MSRSIWQTSQVVLSGILFIMILPFVLHSFSAPITEEVIFCVIAALSITFFCNWHLLVIKNRILGASFASALVWTVVLVVYLATSSLNEAIREYLLMKGIGIGLIVTTISFVSICVFRGESHPKNKVVVSVLIAFVFLLAIEATGHMSFRVAIGKFLWEPSTEFFHVRSFTERIGDARIFTAKRDYSEELYSFDKNRFRVGNYNYKQEKNIVFIGDSIPFGWGVKGKETIQSFIAQKISDYGIINAALPSYSLHQALSRFKEEIHNKFNVSILILQVYDPASQFAIWGKEWSPEISWASDNRKFNERHDSIRRSQVLKYSFLLYMLFPRNDERGRIELALNRSDSEAFSHFNKINTTELNELRRLTNSHIILLPINLTEFAQNNYPSEHLLAVESLNNLFRKYAENTEGVYFFDIQDHFNSLGKQNLFSDNCCHLTPEGNKAQAEFIYDKLEENKLLD